MFDNSAGKRYPVHMATTINIRELYRNLKKITERAEKGESFLVLKNSRPVFKIEPEQKKKPFSIEELSKIRFKGPKDLSKRIDEIVYGDS